MPSRRRPRRGCGSSRVSGSRPSTSSATWSSRRSPSPTSACAGGRPGSARTRRRRSRRRRISRRSSWLGATMGADTTTHYPATEAARERRLQPRLYVGSEVGVLRRVILHRPDLELKRLTPRNKDELLFDDVLWVRRARQEHDAFADALADRGVQVLYLEALLADVLAEPD